MNYRYYYLGYEKRVIFPDGASGRIIDRKLHTDKEGLYITVNNSKIRISENQLYR